MATSRRQQRISELLKEELSIMILELTDVRLDDAMVNVTRVDVSQDLHNARVQIEHHLPAEQSRHVLKALEHAESFLRRGLVERTDLRYVPHLSFHIDDSADRGRRIEELLDRLVGDPQVRENGEPDDTR